MADDLVPYVISVAAILFAALTWLESRKARRLLETMVKAIPFATRRQKRAAKPTPTAPGINVTKAAAEERRRLRLELEREKLQWQKNRDVAKGIAWFLDRLAESDEEYDDE